MQKVADPMNHPYAEKLQETLKTQKKMLECLEKRLVLMTESYATKTEFEKNEIEILRIKTEAEIDILKRVISEKENYFVRYMQQFVADLEDMEKNYERLLKICRAQQNANDGAKQLLNSVKWDVLEKNIEVKVHFYKRMKDFLK